MSDDIDMKLGTKAKLGKKNKTAPKKQMTSCLKIVTYYHFFKLLPIWSNPEAGFRTHSL